MMSNVDLRRLAEKVAYDDDMTISHAARILARAILSLDDPSHFIRNMAASDDKRVEIKPETVTAKRGY